MRKDLPLALVLDGNNIAARAFHKLSLSYQGFDTSAIYGFLNSLHYYAYQYPSSLIAACWDVGVSKRREQIFPEYKQNRKKKREGQTEWEKQRFQDYIRGLNDLRDFLRNIGIYQFSGEDIEADDWISNVSFVLSQRGFKTMVVSSDMDFLQLVTDHVSILRPGNFGKEDSIVDRGSFGLHSSGIPLDRYLEFRAMIGDKSDGIPGVPKVGTATAVKIMERFGGPFQAAVAHQKGSKDRLAKKVAENLAVVSRNMILMDLREVRNKKLMKIVRSELDKKLMVKEDALFEFLIKYGMKDMIRGMSSWLAPFRRMVGECR